MESPGCACPSDGDSGVTAGPWVGGVGGSEHVRVTVGHSGTAQPLAFKCWSRAPRRSSRRAVALPLSGPTVLRFENSPGQTELLYVRALVLSVSPCCPHPQAWGSVFCHKDLLLCRQLLISQELTVKVSIEPWPVWLGG